MLLTILKLLNPSKILSISSAILLVAFLFAYKGMKDAKKEAKVNKSNYEVMLNRDSIKTATLFLKRDRDIEEYLSHNKTLENLLIEQNAKIRKLESVMHQVHTYTDTIIREHKVTKIVEHIRTETVGSVKWKDSTKCLVITGALTYDGEDVKVEVKEREYKSEIALAHTWRRNPKNLLTKIFGRREVVATMSSTCGGSKTIIIKRN